MSPSLRVIINGTIIPQFDLHVPMLSLPAIFQTTSAHISAAVPYLSADQELAEAWKPRLGSSDSFRIGLVWAGSLKPDPRRSTKLSDFRPLWEIPGVTWIAMQSDARWDETHEGLKAIDVGAELRDFSDTTASVLANLDLLITVDTSTAHLAGAMGVRTWTLLPYAADWRWLPDSPTSPWYPTMRLFKQRRPGDWEEVIARIARSLREAVGRL